MPTITLERPLIDYLTVTSWDEMHHDVAKKILSNIGHSIERGNLKENAQRLQYVGVETTKNHLGTMFYGEGMIGPRWHSITQVSGELCNEPGVLNPIISGFREGWLRVRRLDLQITIERPDDWQQWALFNRAKRRRQSVGWVESTSKDGNLLQTVYLGKRTSGKFLRVYEKEFADHVLLRTEYELKGNYAEAYARSMWNAKKSDPETPGALIKLLVTNTKDKALESQILPHLEHSKIADKPKILQAESKTEKWLIDTVLATFKRVINDHSTSDDVLNAYVDAINLHYHQNGITNGRLNNDTEND